MPATQHARSKQETSAQIFDRRRREARKAAANAEHISNPIKNPEAVYALRRRQCDHATVAVDLD